jgi:hypothetical protein
MLRGVHNTQHSIFSSAWWKCFHIFQLQHCDTVKVKVKLSLCFNWAPRHEGILGEWRYISTHSLIWALGGGEWSASLPGRFTLGEIVPGIHWIRGWVGPRVNLDAVERIKFSQPPPGIEPWNPDRPARNLVAIRWNFAMLFLFHLLKQNVKLSTLH